ncbi:hypothetical protein B0O40_0616 [Ruminococcaceae bacterium R-25]|nr:hypothetical protein B0O40_0616 [Ruminococcaceae bacterium R-25]SUQ11246.1 hypothetical protein SAMN06297423_0616 [Oscillospiraceae bacterium]
MKKVLSTLLACSVLLGFAGCNITVPSDDPTVSSEVITDETEGITDASEPEETTTEEKFVEGMIKSSLDEITDKFMNGLGDTHEGQEYLRLNMDPEDAETNKTLGIKDYRNITLGYFSNLTKNGLDNKPETWYEFDAYIFKMDMESDQYKSAAEGGKVNVLIDRNTGAVKELPVVAVRGQYVLCISVEEGKDYVRTLLEDGPEFTSVEITKAIENFSLTS